MRSYIDYLADSEMEKDKTQAGNPQEQQEQANPSESTQPAAASTQPEAANSNANPWGYSDDTMQYLAGRGWDKNRLETFNRFDANKNVLDQLRQIEKSKPVYDEQAERNRRTWGAVGDSVKLLAQLGGAYMGAYIQPNEDSVTDYFAELNDRERKQYLDAMNRYNDIVGKAGLQSAKDAYNQHMADRKEITDLISSKEKHAEWVANQERLIAEAENRKENSDRNYYLNKKKAKHQEWEDQQRISKAWATEQRLAENAGKKAEKVDYDDIFLKIMNDKESWAEIPSYMMKEDNLGNRYPNPAYRTLIVKSFLQREAGKGAENKGVKKTGTVSPDEVFMPENPYSDFRTDYSDEDNSDEDFPILN
jgi:hypothetical protein